MISSTGKQWPGLVVFDSQRSTAGVNGGQQNSTAQWCLSLSAKVTSNKHGKQRRRLNADKLKGLVSAQRHCNTPLVPK